MSHGVHYYICMLFLFGVLQYVQRSILLERQVLQMNSLHVLWRRKEAEERINHPFPFL
jgi:hypothetical protein